MNEACSERTLAIGEPLLGSAGSAHALVAIAWPKPLWHDDKAALSVGLPEALAAIEARETDAGRKLTLRVFQREPRPPTDRVELICVAPDRTLQLRELPAAQLPTRVESFLRNDAVGPPLGGRLVLACTDGQHDRCCAEHGSAFHRALAAHVHSVGAPLEIAESSHLGGHRFAATCLVLPEGHMYGRLRPGDAPQIAAAAAAGSVWSPRYRGRFGLGEAEQVAEGRALERFPGAQRVRVEPSNAPDEIGELRLRVAVEVDRRREDLLVRLCAREFTSATSCAPDAEIETRRRWLPL